MSCDITLEVRTHEEEVTSEVYCLHTPSVAAECHQILTKLLQQIKKYMSSTIFKPTATTRYWKKTNATSGIDKGELVQVAPLLILGGDGS